jgi:16S rRNA (adenine1518-N6/adenine1519-N6)-dimethyltransferase
LIEFRGLFSSLVLMFQREVADRITAKPGSKERGFLTVLVEASLSVEKLFNVPPTAFKPPPKVWSSVVRLTPKPSQVTDTKLFEQVVSTGFGQKRKTILNNLKLHFTDAGDALIAAEVDKNARAEALSLDDWIRLATALKAGKT